MKEYKAIGLMSGSSLDGLDIAFCRFGEENGIWKYSIEQVETIPYDAEWKYILKNIRNHPAEELISLHYRYGLLLGNAVSKFISKHNLSPDLIASHGHTVFHNPDAGYTFQLGDGQAIAVKTGIKTVSDFRIKDVLLGGQGAPLVPIGDELLFSQYGYCLNLGGIANISFKKNGKRTGFDVCPANQLLNYLSMQLGEPYDKNGNFAKLGKLNKPLFDRLNSEPFYKKSFPKSLSNEYVEASFFKILNQTDIPVEDKLYTVVKHIACQVNGIIDPDFKGEILVTGGGARNRFLIKALQQERGKNFIVPDDLTVDFKEALIFALMGVLRIRDEVNCLSSVTGAFSDSSAGTIFYP